MYTLFLKYTIDPNKLNDWREYAEAEFDPITECGGRVTGYYGPTEFAGATSEACADTPSVVPFRYLLSFIPMMLPIRRFFVDFVQDEAELLRIENAWMKSLHLSVALWSRAYVPEDLW